MITGRENVKTLTLDSKIITDQCIVDEDFQLYSYMDHNTKTFKTFYNDELPIKLNIEKIAKKKMNIKNFFKEVDDVRMKLNLEAEKLYLDFYIKD